MLPPSMSLEKDPTPFEFPPRHCIHICNFVKEVKQLFMSSDHNTPASMIQPREHSRPTKKSAVMPHSIEKLHLQLMRLLARSI